jgi:KaiC/GvpD/RAD55 family RecA-like ATPase
VREDLFNVMAHDFDAVIEIKADQSSDRIRYFLNILKMRMTAIPHKVFELDTDSSLLSIRTVQKIT